MNKLLTKIIIWISGLIGWIPYTFYNDMTNFCGDYTTYHFDAGILKLANSIWHPGQQSEVTVWINNYILFASSVDSFGVIEYLTLFDRDIYQNI